MTEVPGDLPNEAFAGWFAGPKAENADDFEKTILHILQDYYHWRRNYFAEDGLVIDSALKRKQEPFHDRFEDRLFELLARLKADFPFHSPRYAAHMIGEQTLPSIAGYFAGMLYNPNNVTAEAGPVTVRLELEAAQCVAQMLGYDDQSWAHITGGGTVANFESLWIARSVKYLPLILRDMADRFHISTGLPNDRVQLLGLNPQLALEELSNIFQAGGKQKIAASDLIDAYRSSPFSVGEHGVASVTRLLESEPVILVPETHHYCLQKACDLLGIGKKAMIRIKVDSDFCMDVADLRATLDAIDKDPTRHVMAVVCVVGSTEEGAVDPVHEVVALREERERAGKESFWIHADAAYGGYLRTMTIPKRIGLGAPVTRTKVRGKEFDLPLKLPEKVICEALERLGETDSVAIDPHKLGFVPYPAGVVCFRSNLVKPVARQDAPYLEERTRGPAEERENPNIGVYILEGSKPGAAAASVWLSHKLIPLDASGHGKLMREIVRNACELSVLLEDYAQYAGHQPVQAVCLCPPASNILCFAFRPTSGKLPLGDVNRLNRAIYERFTVSEHSEKTVYEQGFFLSRTEAHVSQYSSGALKPFLDRLGISEAEYEKKGVFLLRSTLMNPWYGLAKEKGRFFIGEMVDALYAGAAASL